MFGSALAILLGADRGDVARAEITPIGVRGRQRGSGFFGAQKQEAVSRSEFEGLLQSIKKFAVEPQSVGIGRHQQVAVRSEG